MTRDTVEAFLAVTGPIIVINLPHRADRRAEFAAQLARIGLGFDHPQVQLFPAVRPDGAGGFPTIGTRGCFLSHLAILREAVAEGKQSLLICEDDLDFTADMMPRLRDMTAALTTQPWDMFYGGYDAEPTGAMIAPGLVQAEPARGIGCTHFYAIRGAAIADLVRYLDLILTRPPGHPDGGPMHYDGALAWFRKDHPQYVTLAAVPPLGVQRPSRTDVHALRWFDRLPLVRGFVGGLRRIRAQGMQK